MTHYWWYNDGTWMTIHTQNWLGTHTFFVISITPSSWSQFCTQDQWKRLNFVEGCKTLRTRPSVGYMCIFEPGSVRYDRGSGLTRPNLHIQLIATDCVTDRFRDIRGGVIGLICISDLHLHIGLFAPPLVPLSLMYSRANISPVWRVLLQDKDVMLKSHNILKLVDFHCTCAREWIAHTAHGRKMEGF